MALLPRRKALQCMGLLATAPWLLPGCSESKREEVDWGDGEATGDGLSEADLARVQVNEILVEGLNQLGWELLCTLPDQNQLISPVSLGLCLAMLERGAEGATRDEIRRVLHLPEKPDLTDPGWKTLSSFLRVEKPHRQVRLANGLFLQSGYPVGPDFQKELADWFQAKLKEVDFEAHPADANSQINDWIKARTGNLLHDRSEPNLVSRETRLVLVNLIQFKGEWEKAFEKSLTAPGDFEVAPGQNQSVLFMNRPRGDFPIRKTQHARAIEFPCKSLDRSVHLILPNRRHGLSEWIDPKIDPQWGKLLFGRGDRFEVKVTVPKFSFESNLILNDSLSRLGMPRAFRPSEAEFFRMNGGKEPLYVSLALHKARFVMDEEGAKAVAVTKMYESPKSGKAELRSEPFIADQPFLVAITDKSTRSILFLGRVHDPKSQPVATSL